MADPYQSNGGAILTTLPNQADQVSIRDRDDIEATELSEYEQEPSAEAHGGLTEHGTREATSARPPKPYPGRLQKFWKNHITITVAHDDCRDHFALERTFLGYARTSLALSIIGVLIAQLFRLQQPPSPGSTMGFYTLGKPLGVVCIGSAIVVSVLGGWRFWKQQNSMVRGKIHAGGWELIVIGVLILLITVAIFLLLIVVDVKIDL